MFIVQFKTRPSYFKGAISFVLIYTEIGSCDASRFNTLLIYFEWTGEESVSDSEFNISILNQGKEAIIRLRFGFVLKLDCVTPVSTIGMGKGSRFCFWLLKRGLDADEP